MLYGVDAVYVATEIYKSVTVLKYFGQGKSLYYFATFYKKTCDFKPHTYSLCCHVLCLLFSVFTLATLYSQCRNNR